MNTTLLSKLTFIYGTVLGIVYVVVFRHYAAPFRIAIDLAIAWLLFFVGYRFTFYPAWNLRARQLSQDGNDAPQAKEIVPQQGSN